MIHPHAVASAVLHEQVLRLRRLRACGATTIADLQLIALHRAVYRAVKAGVIEPNEGDDWRLCAHEGDPLCDLEVMTPFQLFYGDPVQSREVV